MLLIQVAKFGFYDSFYDQVHVNEKWFYVHEVKQRFNLTEGERGWGPIFRLNTRITLKK